MPLWSVQEWRARIGSSWCALGRPIKSKSSYCRGGNCIKSPPSRGRKRTNPLDVDVSVIIMIVLWIGAVLMLWYLVLDGSCLVFISELLLQTIGPGIKVAKNVIL